MPAAILRGGILADSAWKPTTIRWSAQRDMRRGGGIQGTNKSGYTITSKLELKFSRVMDTYVYIYFYIYRYINRVCSIFTVLVLCWFGCRYHIVWITAAREENAASLVLRAWVYCASLFGKSSSKVCTTLWKVFQDSASRDAGQESGDPLQGLHAPMESDSYVCTHLLYFFLMLFLRFFLESAYEHRTPPLCKAKHSFEGHNNLKGEEKKRAARPCHDILRRLLKFYGGPHTRELLVLTANRKSIRWNWYSTPTHFFFWNKKKKKTEPNLPWILISPWTEAIDWSSEK